MDVSDDETESPSQRMLRVMLRELMREKKSREEVRALGLLAGVDLAEAAAWRERVIRVKGLRLELATSLSAAAGPVDAVLVLSARGLGRADLDRLAGEAEHPLLPGGTLLVPVEAAVEPCLRDLVLEAGDPQPGEEPAVARLRRVAVPVNLSAAQYWAGQGEPQTEEVRLLGNVTLALSAAERSRGQLSEASLARGVTALVEQGLVILRGLFASELVLAYREAVVEDMRSCLSLLRERGVDLLKPGEGGGRIENFYELSMREARRCDLRRCPRMERLRESAVAGALPDLRHHSSVLELLRRAMHPPGEHQSGNWGRWNFEGPGPDAPPTLVVGEVASVVTLPGCLDQTVHADTPHIFVHTHLPPHYVNMFLPTLEDKAAGQTAFVLGSHRLAVSKTMMTTADGENVLMSRLVRPHLSPGDCLLFDCRVLHFGLGNSSDSFRPILYVNYHADWFHDPKNWNESDRIFRSC